MRFCLIVIVFLIQFCTFSQEEVSDNISDCTGAVNVLGAGTFDMQFTGGGGNVKELASYPSLSHITELNSLWASFISPFQGEFTLNAKVQLGVMKMIVFTSETGDICGDIMKGKAEVLRLLESTNSNQIGLSKTVNNNYFFPIELTKGQQIMVLLIFDSTKKSKLELTVNCDPKFKNVSIQPDETKVVDQREDEFSPSINIKVKNSETGRPVIADIVLTDGKKLNSFFQGSDFYFIFSKPGKVHIRVDAQGYFFTDREEFFKANTDQEFTIWLEPVAAGKVVQLDEIEFMPGTSDLLPSSEPKLRRLKEFLALNANLKVEIQGHVQEKGENSPEGQKISEARAKKVMKYLHDNGIERSRMVAVGYGNTRPIYPDPKFAYEEQANRRVEIKIL